MLLVLSAALKRNLTRVAFNASLPARNAAFFRPLGDIDDFDRRPLIKQALYDGWDASMNDQLSVYSGSPDFPQFFNQKNAPNDPVNERMITWNAFPLSLEKWYNTGSDPTGKQKALEAAESLFPFTEILFVSNGRVVGRPRRLLYREDLALEDVDGRKIKLHQRQQDEYCEWFVDRDMNQRITRITYTSEGPEYWNFMATQDITLVGDLYREHVNLAVKDDDLIWQKDIMAAAFDAQTRQFIGRIRHPSFVKGAYNPFNEWNTTKGVMHLIQPNNTLFAEIDLAAGATVRRRTFSLPSTPINPSELTACAGFGDVNRSSDPNIGTGVYRLALSGLSVSLKNPIGLYIKEVSLNGLKGPDGQILDDRITHTRQSPGKEVILRSEIKLKPSDQFTLDQCQIDGENIRYGGQIAKKITMGLFGIAKNQRARPRVAECEGSLCRNPQATGFFAVVGAGESCSQINWDNFKPFRDPNMQLNQLENRGVDSSSINEDEVSRVGRSRS